MRYKFLALDLDDTLLNEDLKISTRNLEALNKAIKKGMMVTLATGRMFRSAYPYAGQLNNNIDFPIIVYHGALIKTMLSKNILHYKPVPYEEALKILQLAEAEKFHVNFYVDDRLFVEEENENSRYYQKIAAVQVEEVGSLVKFIKDKNQEPTKLAVVNMDGRFQKIQELLVERFSPELSIRQSRPYFLEITDKEATKGNALAFLAQQEGISREEIIAIGDSYNDIDMLKFAGLGVAVGNAPAEVKEAADIITASNVEDGVALFLEEHIFA